MEHNTVSVRAEITTTIPVPEGLSAIDQICYAKHLITGIAHSQFHQAEIKFFEITPAAAREVHDDMFADCETAAIAC